MSNAMTTKDGLEGSEMVTMSGSDQALAAALVAGVQARHIVAFKRPRSIDAVRQLLLKECTRPGFAAKARYKKPTGRDAVYGPSIRFAEAALRLMGNNVVETLVVRDDDKVRVLRVSVCDLETNATFFKDVSVEKTVEKSKIPEGMTPLGQRRNSRGEWAYLLPATEGDLLNKEAALVSKAIRTCALRLIPFDLVDEAMATVIATQRKEDARDPDAARKRIVDEFGAIGVLAAGLVEWLGHDLDALTADELLDLRAIYLTLRDGEATWTQVLEARRAERAGEGGAVVGEAAPGTNPATPEAKKTAGVRERIEAKRSKLRGGGKAPPAAPGAPPSDPATPPAHAAVQADAALAEIARMTDQRREVIAEVLRLRQEGRDDVWIARYGRDVTGGLAEVLVGEISARLVRAGLLAPTQAPGDADPDQDGRP